MTAYDSHPASLLQARVRVRDLSGVSNVLLREFFQPAFLATSVLLMASCAPQMAQTPPVTACEHPWDGGKKGQDRGLTMQEISGSEMTSFVENYNAADPPTDYAPDHLFLFTHEVSSSALMIMVQDNCIIKAEPVPLAALPLLLGGRES